MGDGMAKQGLVVRVRVDGARQTVEAFNLLPAEASRSLRTRTKELSETLAAHVKSAGMADGGPSALVASTVKANRDRVPSITAGGAKRVGHKRTPASDLVFISEFGANRRTGWYAASRYESSNSRQFRPHLGRGSYWFFSTVEAHEPEISRAWRLVADDIIEAFTRG